jgi:hypothetical protein
VRRQALSRGQVGSDGAFPWTHTSAFSVRRGLEPGPRLDSICEGGKEFPLLELVRHRN